MAVMVIHHIKPAEIYLVEKSRLKIAVQKSGRLAERSLDLLSKCGITLEKSKDQLLCRAQNPLDVLLVRDDDIPHLFPPMYASWALWVKMFC